MVDHELQRRRKFSFPDTAHVPQKQFDLVKRFNKDEEIKNILENLQKKIRYIDSEENKAEFGKNGWNSEELSHTLSNLGSELLSRPPSDTRRFPIVTQLKQLEQAYKHVMEMFLYMMEKFLQSIGELRQDLKKSIQKFHKCSRFTAEVTLVSFATEVAVTASRVMHRVFHFSLSPKVGLVSTVVGGLSLTASVLALWYMKQSIVEISRQVKAESRFFMDLIIVHRKGNWIDKEMLRLFPHGIDLKFLHEKAIENSTILEDKMSWRLYLCSVIILTNIQKEPGLLKDEKFLTSVKLFVESQAAEIWWHRIKIKKLLDGMLRKMDDTSVKEFIAVHKIHYNRTALCLYPMLVPLILTSWNSTRIFCSSFAGLMAYGSLVNNETEKYEKLKQVSHKFEKDFAEITEICRMLDNDYD